MKIFKFLCILSALILFSCNTEESILENSNDQVNLGRNSTESSGNYYLGVQAIHMSELGNNHCETSNNILVFNSVEHYIQVLETLEQQVEDEDDFFFNQNSYMTLEELDAYEETIGYNEQQPLIDFENNLNFCSLRKHVLFLEDKWLDLQPVEFDPTGDPDEEKAFGLNDWEEMTLYNPDGEIIIGRNFYKLFNNGNGWVEIDLNNPNLGVIVGLINQNPNEVTDSTIRTIIRMNANVTNLNSNNPQVCKDIANRAKYEVVSNDVRAKLKHKVQIGPFNHNIISKTVSYKLKRGKWKRRRNSVDAGYKNTIISYPCSECGVNNPINESESIKNRRSRKYSLRQSRFACPYGFRYLSEWQTKSYHHIGGNDIFWNLPN